MTIYSKLEPYLLPSSCEHRLRKRKSIANLVICFIPVLAILVLGFENSKIFTEPTPAVFVGIGAWVISEIILIWFFYITEVMPKIVREGFQLNLLCSNMWFLWALLFSYEKIT